MKTNEKRTNKKLRIKSGKITYEDDLTCFLYLLMRDKLPTGIVEQLVRDVEGKPTIEYTNGWLAQYAKYLSYRLKER